MSVCVLYANTIESLNKFIDFDYENLSLKLLVLPPPTKKKKKCKPFLGKNPEYTSLNIFKTMPSSQPFLNLSKYISEDQVIYFEDLHFSVSQIVHSLFYRLCLQALLCCLKSFTVQQNG